MKVIPACSRCRFFHADDPPSQGSELDFEGECRRHCPVAPQPSSDDRHVGYAYWPVVLSSDWCGEFKAIDNPRVTTHRQCAAST